MRTITNSATLSQQVTQPKYLVAIGWDTPVYLSSGATTDYDGNTYTAAPLRVGQIQTDGSGQARVSLALDNHDRAFGAVALADSGTEQTVTIYVAYDHATAAISPLLLFAGVIDGLRVGEVLELACLAKAAFRGKSPRIVCGPPVFNHLPPDGSSIVWGSKTLELRRR